MLLASPPLLAGFSILHVVASTLTLREPSPALILVLPHSRGACLHPFMSADAWSAMCRGKGCDPDHCAIDMQQERCRRCRCRIVLLCKDCRDNGIEAFCLCADSRGDRGVPTQQLEEDDEEEKEELPSSLRSITPQPSTARCASSLPPQRDYQASSPCSSSSFSFFSPSSNTARSADEKQEEGNNFNEAAERSGAGSRKRAAAARQEMMAELTSVLDALRAWRNEAQQSTPASVSGGCPFIGCTKRYPDSSNMVKHLLGCHLNSDLHRGDRGSNAYAAWAQRFLCIIASGQPAKARPLLDLEQQQDCDSLIQLLTRLKEAHETWKSHATKRTKKEEKEEKEMVTAALRERAGESGSEQFSPAAEAHKLLQQVPHSAQLFHDRAQCTPESQPSDHPYINLGFFNSGANGSRSWRWNVAREMSLLRLYLLVERELQLTHRNDIGAAGRILFDFVLKAGETRLEQQDVQLNQLRSALSPAGNILSIVFIVRGGAAGPDASQGSDDQSGTDDTDAEMDSNSQGDESEDETVPPCPLCSADTAVFSLAGSEQADFQSICNAPVSEDSRALMFYLTSFDKWGLQLMDYMMVAADAETRAEFLQKAREAGLVPLARHPHRLTINVSLSRSVPVQEAVAGASSLPNATESFSLVSSPEPFLFSPSSIAPAGDSTSAAVILVESSREAEVRLSLAHALPRQLLSGLHQQAANLGHAWDLLLQLAGLFPPIVDLAGTAADAKRERLTRLMAQIDIALDELEEPRWSQIDVELALWWQSCLELRDALEASRADLRAQLEELQTVLEAGRRLSSWVIPTLLQLAAVRGIFVALRAPTLAAPLSIASLVSVAGAAAVSVSVLPIGVGIAVSVGGAWAWRRGGAAVQRLARRFFSHLPSNTLTSLNFRGLVVAVDTDSVKATLIETLREAIAQAIEADHKLQLRMNNLGAGIV
jgi:hypothetical protein